MCANFAGKKTPTQNKIQHKLKGESMIPNTLLTPDSSSDCGFPLSKITTAKFDSSVFLTPPCTLEKESCQIQCYDLSNPPILNLDPQEQGKIAYFDQTKCRSPPLREGGIILNTVRAATSRFDFISRLLDSGCVHIIKNILRWMDARDLCRAAIVSRTWRKCIQDDRDFHEKWKSCVLEYRDHYYNEKENLGTQKVSKLQLEREPLAEIFNQNIFSRTVKTRQQSKAEKDAQNVFQELSLPRTSEQLKRCPKCTSPSRNKDGKNHCVCEICGLEFCSKCLKDTKLHNTANCTGLEILQSRRKTASKRTKDTIGSKTSRSRVRRL